jgi:hypothetical protein
MQAKACIPLAAEPKKSKWAVRKKVERFGLEVVVHKQKTCCPSSSNLELPEDLPSVEEQLRVWLSSILAVLFLSIK